MSFQIVRRFPLVKELACHYYSFPTALINSNGIVLVSYRDACFDGGTLAPDYDGHGDNGDMYILGWDPKNEKTAFHYKVYDHRKTGENEQNTILSSAGGDDIYMFSRQHGRVNRVFFAVSKNGGEGFSERNEVSLKEFEFLACYGKIREFQNLLVAPVYGVSPDYDPDNRRCGAAWIYSDKKSFQWKFGGWISPPIKGGPSFNETALITRGRQGLALLRSGEGGETLYGSVSADGMNGWSKPESAGFRGEAPELHDLGKGMTALSYRGFQDDGSFCRALSISKDFGKSWDSPRVLNEYKGSRFHGGYGDIVRLKNNYWMDVSYGPGKSGLPGINAVIFTL